MVKIRVRIYDVIRFNSAVRFLKLGMYHTSVTADDIEYHYLNLHNGKSGLEFRWTGVEMQQYTLYQEIYLCEIKKSSDEIRQIFTTFVSSPEWLSEHYNSLMHNSNNFSRAFCEALLGKENMQKYPFWVFRSQHIARIFYTISLSHFMVFFRNRDHINMNPPYHSKKPKESEKVEEERKRSILTRD